VSGFASHKDTIAMTQCLIVEAAPDDRRRLEDLLAPYGFAVDATETAQAALDRCRRWAPDVVLLPQALRSMNLLAFLRLLRRQSGRRSPVVLLVGDTGDAGEIGRAIWEGASECLMKPFDADVLDLKLRQAGVV
jgi:two-component system chemotaxis response regulator CheY